MAGLFEDITQERLTSIADGLVVVTAVVLPWSTSATAIAVVLWVLALLPTLQWPDVRREIMSPAGVLPVLLVTLGTVGMLWADVTLLERWKGLDSFVKLLAIPLLFAQFRRSGRGEWVFLGYLASCVALLAATTIVILTPWAPALINYNAGTVLVKNAPTQAGEFVTCIFGLLFLAHEAVERRRWGWLLICVAIIVAMLADIVYLSTSRTAMIVALVLLVLFVVKKKLKAWGVAVALGSAILVGVVGWISSPYLRGRTEAIQTELQKYEANNERTSSGERLVFWTKSIDFVRQSPVFGHGTGSIHALFEKSAVGQTGPAGVGSTNPHNQTLAVAIQLGLIGAAILWAMWIAHLLLFRGSGLAAWVGLVVVVQNVVGSLFNSHLFDFVQGWVYVVGVGVAGRMIEQARYRSDVTTRESGVGFRQRLKSDQPNRRG